MENDQEFEEQEQYYEEQDDAVEIYSRNAILGFSIFFSTIFGGTLLVINLFKAGLRKAAWIVLTFSVTYQLVGLVIAKSITIKNGFLLLIPIVFNVGGGLILTNYFFPKYLPDDDYYPRSIWSALMVSIIVSLGVMLLTSYFVTPTVKPVK